MNPEAHARQLWGIAQRHGHHTVADLPRIPERPRNDYRKVRKALRRLKAVRQVTFVDREDMVRPALEIVLDTATVGPAVMDRLRVQGFAIDPDRTQSRAEHTVVVAV